MADGLLWSESDDSDDVYDPDLEAQSQRYADMPCPPLDELHKRLDMLIRERRRHERRERRIQVRFLQELAELRGAVFEPSRYFSFRLFTRLPEELRRRIWEMAIPCRLAAEAGPFTHKNIYCLSPPVISQVCHESRQLALKLGGLRQIGNVKAIWTWFTPSRDVVMLERATQGVHKAVAEEVLFDLPLLEFFRHEGLYDYYIREHVGILSRYPRLKTINVIVRGKVEFVDRMWNPHVVAKLFGNDSLVLVDMRDAGEVARISAVIKAGTQPGGVLDSSSSILERMAESLAEPWEPLKKIVMKTMLETRFLACPLTIRNSEDIFDANGDPNMEIPWVRGTVESVDIRPVFAFALCDGKPKPEEQ